MRCRAKNAHILLRCSLSMEAPQRLQQTRSLILYVVQNWCPHDYAGYSSNVVEIVLLGYGILTPILMICQVLEHPYPGGRRGRPVKSAAMGDGTFVHRRGILGDGRKRKSVGVTPRRTSAVPIAVGPWGPCRAHVAGAHSSCPIELTAFSHLERGESTILSIITATPDNPLESHAL